MSNEVDSNVTEIYEKHRIECTVKIVLETRQDVKSNDEFFEVVKKTFERMEQKARDYENLTAFFEEHGNDGVDVRDPKEEEDFDAVVVLDLDKM